MKKEVTIIAETSIALLLVCTSRTFLNQRTIENYAKKWKFLFFNQNYLHKSEENWKFVCEALTNFWPKFHRFFFTSHNVWWLSDRNRCASHNNSHGRMSERRLFQYFNISNSISNQTKPSQGGSTTSLHHFSVAVFLFRTIRCCCCEKFTLSRMSEYFSKI